MDFNPNLKNPEDFELPLEPTTRLSRISLYLRSILVAPITIRGVDLSHWNGNVDFLALKGSGIDFVILKATEDTDFVDPEFDTYWRSSLDVGLAVMTYHFFRSNYGGAPQATHHINTIQEFVNTAKYQKPLFWFDMETEDGASITQRRNRLLAGCQTAVSNGYQTGYYSSKYLWEKLIGDVSWANGYWQWPAHWTDGSEPLLPVGWTREKSKVWQYGIYPRHDWVDPVRGTPGDVDCNYFYGTVQDLHDWLGIVPQIDCCEEIKAEIARIDEELVLIRSQISTINEINTNHEGRIIETEQNDVLLENKITEIETLIQSIKDIFCI